MRLGPLLRHRPICNRQRSSQSIQNCVYRGAEKACRAPTRSRGWQTTLPRQRGSLWSIVCRLGALPEENPEHEQICRELASRAARHGRRHSKPLHELFRAQSSLGFWDLIIKNKKCHTLVVLGVTWSDTTSCRISRQRAKPQASPRPAGAPCTSSRCLVPRARSLRGPRR